MSLTLAFDVYGTLINTHGVVQALEKIMGQQAMAFSQTWRAIQLEYSFRRGLMNAYQDFGICTSQALDYTCRFYRQSLSAEQKTALLESYGSLPAFADVAGGLQHLQTRDCRLFAFSNGRAAAVDALLKNANIRDIFEGIVSCDDVETFKPNPAVYTHFLNEAGSSPDSTWLISSNPFDVIGAVAAGWQAAWVKRSETAIFDPWEFEPTTTITGLDELKEQLSL